MGASYASGNPTTQTQTGPMYNPISNLVTGRTDAVNALHNVLQGGGMSIADVIARVARNQQMMQSALQPPATAAPNYSAMPTNLAPTGLGAIGSGLRGIY